MNKIDRLNTDLLKQDSYFKLTTSKKIKDLTENDLQEVQTATDCDVIYIPASSTIIHGKKDFQFKENNPNPMCDNEERSEYRKGTCFFAFGEYGEQNSIEHGSVAKYRTNKGLYLINWNNSEMIEYLTRHLNEEWHVFFKKIIHPRKDCKGSDYINRESISDMDYRIVKELSPFFKDSILDGIVGGYMFNDSCITIGDIYSDEAPTFPPEIIIPNLTKENVSEIIDLNCMEFTSVKLCPDTPMRPMRPKKKPACFMKADKDTSTILPLSDFNRDLGNTTIPQNKIYKFIELNI